MALDVFLLANIWSVLSSDIIKEMWNHIFNCNSNVSFNWQSFYEFAENLTSQRYYKLEKVTRVYGNSFVALLPTTSLYSHTFSPNWSNSILLSLISRMNYFFTLKNRAFLENQTRYVRLRKKDFSTYQIKKSLDY